MAFNEMSLDCINAEVLGGNKRSQRFHEKLGFTSDGVRRTHHLAGKGDVAVHHYHILAGQWQKLQGKT